jgi:hypothetical protein
LNNLTENSGKQKKKTLKQSFFEQFSKKNNAMLSQKLSILKCNENYQQLIKRFANKYKKTAIR